MLSETTEDGEIEVYVDKHLCEKPNEARGIWRNVIRINANAATLSNYEVLTLLQELRGSQKRTNNQSQLATITYETIKYLQDTPCNLQTPEMIHKFLKALEPYKLTKAEKLLLLNNPPKTPLEIQLIVEESEERFSDEQVEELLQLVQSCELIPNEAEPE
uniref:DNA-directed RNA polymerase III subunit RPC9 n=1 Tax=Timema genevievae TaxID=629358 RepID=A0A7R9PRN3_TIMGE|nr:unnamed protein product [Timema genevievae]